ncbi:MAG TPA: O-antigen ligase family protein [Kiritimatiellia bacterium]|nr:O-antigen ligase family protein [Kiritimatiellia bacterium]
MNPVRGFPSTVSREATLTSGVWWFAGLLVAGLALRIPARGWRWFQWGAVFAGGGLALTTLAQRLTPRPFPVYEVTGIFANENHYAAMINLLLPCVVTLGIRERMRAFQQATIAGPASLVLLVAGIMVLSIAVTGSRAGMALATLHVCGCTWLYHRLVGQYPFASPPMGAWVVRSLGLIGLGLVGWTVRMVWRDWNGWSFLRGELEFRLGMIRDGWSIWQAHFWWGTGPGTYGLVLPYYQSSMFDGRVIQHAHFEPVQWLAEMGLAGTLVLLVAWGCLVVASPRPKAERTLIPARHELEGAGFLLAWLTLGLHSLLDFPFRSPWIAMVAAGWLGFGISSVRLALVNRAFEIQSDRTM